MCMAASIAALGGVAMLLRVAQALYAEIAHSEASPWFLVGCLFLTCFAIAGGVFWVGVIVLLRPRPEYSRGVALAASLALFFLLPGAGMGVTSGAAFLVAIAGYFYWRRHDVGLEPENQ
jgi:hypothetical protein